jgi:hypothetical protein
MESFKDSDIAVGVASRLHVGRLRDHVDIPGKCRRGFLFSKLPTPDLGPKR